MRYNSDAYKFFKILKGSHSVVTVRIYLNNLVGVHVAYRTHRDYVRQLFKDKGYEITRWAHDYDSFLTNHPKLGIVYLAGDSVLEDVYEAHGLVGHNIRELPDE